MSEDSFSSTPGPRVQKLVAITSWAIPIIGGLALRRLTAFPGLVGALRLPVSVAGWFIFYRCVCKLLQKYGGDKANKNYAGYPGWSYFCGMVHGLGSLSTLWALASRAYLAENGLSLSELDVMEFLNAPWAPVAAGSSSMYLEQIHCAVIGYLLKDYAVDAGLETAYIVHHLASVIGCTMCLHFPQGAALVTLNAYQSEFTSALFSFSTVNPSLATKLMYFLTMGPSNFGAAVLAYIVHGYRMPLLPFRATYSGLAVLLVTLRTAGLCIEIKKFLSVDPKKDA